MVSEKQIINKNLAKLATTIYVLHCFDKKTQRTRQSDIDLAQQRYRELMQNNP